MLNKLKTILLLFCLTASSYAAILLIPEQGDVVGARQHTRSEVNETIDEVGRRFNMGYWEMVNANPKVDPIHFLPANTPLIIPSQFRLPKVARRGIVIDLAAYRLYYFPPDENTVITFPVGIGKKGWETPRGVTKVSAKVRNPVWRPSAKLQAAAEELGASIPDVVPSGPHNPLGQYALRLGWPGILIHGSNHLDGIGAKVSAGCIRMLPEDIEYLFNAVPVGTSVRVI